MFQLVSYKWFRRTQYITLIGLKYNVCGYLVGGESECEKLSRDTQIDYFLSNSLTIHTSFNINDDYMQVILSYLAFFLIFF